MTTLREKANGKWLTILPALGVDRAYLTGKHGACPICKGGKDRFRFDNKGGDGTWFCSGCNRAGDGIRLVELVNGWDFKTAVPEIEKAAGVAEFVAPRPANDPARTLTQMRNIWRTAEPLQNVDAARLYWMARVGGVPPCADLRGVGELYLSDDRTRRPGSVALVRDRDGEVVNMHRTYLRADGEKADIASPRKLMATALPKGSAVQLMGWADTLGIAEGIETAVSASILFGTPVWAAINSENLKAWTPPEGVRRVMVFGDNDASLTGQAAAYELGRRLVVAKFKVEVHIPPDLGDDWNDVHRARLSERRTA